LEKKLFKIALQRKEKVAPATSDIVLSNVEMRIARRHFACRF